MNTTSNNNLQPATACSRQLARVPSEIIWRSPRKADYWICLVFLVILNLPLLTGSWNYQSTFLPSAVAAGEWWRVLTAPFVHVSVYHLLVDGVAFALLYSSLSEKSPGKRLSILSASALGGLLVPLWVSPEIQQVGLCGMSGVAHGLMTVCALDLISAKDKTARTMGWISFGVVFAKCLGEAISGRLIFDLVHFGNVGMPIVTCHAGGMLGALIAVACFRLFRSQLTIDPRSAALYRQRVF